LRVLVTGDTEADQSADYNAAICLAALSDHPFGDLNLAVTYPANLEGKLQLACTSKRTGAARFAFASWSLYIATDCRRVTEDTDLLPVAHYGETDVLVERGLSLPTDGSLSPAHLLNATADGVSLCCASTSS